MIERGDGELINYIERPGRGDFQSLIGVCLRLGAQKLYLQDLAAIMADDDDNVLMHLPIRYLQVLGV